MPDDETVTETVNRLKGLHEDLGFEIEGGLQERENESEVFYEFLHRQRPAWEVATWGAPDRDYVGLEYRYNLLADLSQQLSEEQVEEWADPMEDIDELRESTYAASNILSAIDEDTRSDIKFRLLNKLDTGDTWSLLSEQLDISFAEFNVVYRVFPYEDDVGFREYEEAMKSVMNTGRTAHRFLRYTLELDASGEDEPVQGMIAEQRK